MKKLGFLDARRPVVGGIAGWSGVPAILVPGHMNAFGIFEDFLHSTELAAGATVPGWELDATGTTLSIADIIGGCVLLTTGGTDNDTGQLTLGSLDGGAFWPQAGKDIWFEARVKHSYSHADENLAFGLQDPSATEYLGDDGAGAAVNNHLFFSVLDGESEWYFEGDKAGETDRNALGKTPEDLVFHTYGFHVRGVTQVDVYYDRELVAAGKVVTDNIPVTGLMPFIFIKAGSGNAEAIYVDYIMCVQER